MLAANTFRIFQKCKNSCEDAFHLFVNCERFHKEHILDLWRLTLLYMNMISWSSLDAFVVLEVENIHIVAKEYNDIRTTENMLDDVMENKNVIIIGTTNSTHVSSCSRHFKTCEELGMIVAVPNPNVDIVFDMLHTRLLMVFDPENEIQHIKDKEQYDFEKRKTTLAKLESWCKQMAEKLTDRKLQKQITLSDLNDVQIPRLVNCLSRARKNWYDSKNKCLHTIPDEKTSCEKPQTSNNKQLVENLSKTSILSKSNALQLNKSQGMTCDMLEKTPACSEKLTSEITMNINWLSEAWNIFTDIGERVLMDF